MDTTFYRLRAIILKMILKIYLLKIISIQFYLFPSLKWAIASRH